ncbi:hypothetical protein K2173_010416 [Erythroxylum novogranatense]|uniref:RING-type E3 ubiquitin transferase n=1 Tax=Erythroxylum novogranatense TaxID=1862640 RepID=A0AAV8TDL2_9ROSI|nr:hypothetical protein K2173_010416 [Erythroxylum novogranatense]
MVLPTSQNSNPYSLQLQLKLYQAFIFSIPILFSIILFLLFYLFYLKRRASTLSPSPHSGPPSSYQSSAFISTIGLKKEVTEKLPTIFLDEELRRRESQCCVCLGDFEMKEELLQIPSCKHVFHIECIHHWLRSNSTCPLCRTLVIPTAPKVDNVQQTSGHPQPPDQDYQFRVEIHQHPQILSPQRQELGSTSGEDLIITVDPETVSQACSTSSPIAVESETGQRAHAS